MKRFEFMIRGAITALAALGLLATGPVANAQSVTVNSTQVCSSAPALSMDPAGNLTITCTPAAPGGGTAPPTIPSCTIPSVAVTIPAGATTTTATVGAVCSGSPATYAWTSSDVPAFVSPTTASVTVGPLPASTYHFTVVATNTAGSSPSAAGTLTINPAPAGGGTAGCATGPTNAVFSGNFTGDHPTIVSGSFASYVLPTFTAANNSYMNFTAVESNNTISGLPIEYTVSPCVGDFTSTSVPPFCTAFGTANSGIALNAFEGNTATTTGVAVCIMQPNTQYYLNVRAAKPPAPGVNSCPAGSCSLYVQFHLTPY
jgi:hypothetical protein